MDIQDAFEEFSKNIELTKGENKSASKSVKKIEATFKSLKSSKVVEVRPVGSYKRNTKISPLESIEVLIVLQASSKSDARHAIKHEEPKTVIASLEGELKSKFSQVTTSSQHPFIVIEFKSHIVEATPAFEESRGTYLVPTKHLTRWKKVNFQKLEEQIVKLDNKNHQKLVPLIRMIKIWRNHKKVAGGRMASYRIEEVACELFNKASLENYPDALSTWFSKFKPSIFKRVLKFGGILAGLKIKGLLAATVTLLIISFVTELLKEEDQEHFNSAHDLTVKARELVQENKVERAKKHYSTLFGKNFPL